MPIELSLKRLPFGAMTSAPVSRIDLPAECPTRRRLRLTQPARRSSRPRRPSPPRRRPAQSPMPAGLQSGCSRQRKLSGRSEPRRDRPHPSQDRRRRRQRYATLVRPLPCGGGKRSVRTDQIGALDRPDAAALDLSLAASACCVSHCARGTHGSVVIWASANERASPVLPAKGFEAAGETSPCSIHEPTISGGAARETAPLLQRLMNCEGRRLSFGAGFRRRHHSWEKRPGHGARISPPRRERKKSLPSRSTRENIPMFSQPVVTGASR